MKFAGGSIIFTGLRADVFVFTAIDGNGRSGREVGKECVRAGCGLGCAEAASGDDTRGRDAAGLKGEGVAMAADMTAGDSMGKTKPC